MSRFRLLIPPPLIGLLTAAAIWGLAEAWPNMTFQFTGQKWLAGLVMAVGLSLDLLALGAFRRAKTTVTPLKPEQASVLVSEGLYRFTRNPMYLGLLLILSGWSIWVGLWLAPPLLIAFVLYITEFQIKPEEERLSEIFGEEFARYRSQVRRWF